MKKLFLLFILLFSILQIGAQRDYVPMAVENARSIVYVTDADGYPPFLDYYFGYRIADDIEINSIVYKKVYFRNFAPVYPDLGNPVQEPFFIENEYLLGAIRDDVTNKKVYGIQFCDEPPINDCPCNEEFLMYDFSLEVDDILDSCIIGGILNQLDMENFMGQNRLVQYYWMPTDTRKVYEGIGGEYGLFNRIWPCFEYSCPYFYYYCIGTDEECFDGFLLANSEYNLQNEVSIYPIPVTDILYIDNSTTDIETIQVYDVLGKLVTQELHNLEQIDVSLLKSGVYLVRIETDKGVITKKVIKK